MFEKEAEEWTNKKLCSERICYNHCNFNSPKHHRCGEWHRIYECAKESAEFGYNKVNQWHYVKDEKPKDNEYVLIYTDLKNTYVARIPTEKDYFVTRCGGFVQMSAVIAWKEIVLPELKESE